MDRDRRDGVGDGTAFRTLTGRLADVLEDCGIRNPQCAGLIALVALVNLGIAALPPVAGAPLSLERIAGWLFAVIRSCGWWVYVVYLPIFCIEAGLGDKVGGIALSVSNALLFAAPALNRMARRLSVICQ